MIREILHIRTDNGLGDKDPLFKDIELTEYSAKYPRMGFPELTATLMWDEALDDEWTGNEYVVLRGERFYINDTPHSEKSNNDARWKHEIEFTSEFARILGNTYFEDAVPSYAETYDKPCSNSSKFTFYGTISEFCDRLNCSFLKAGIADSRIKTKTSLSTLDNIVGDGYCAILDPYGAGSVYDPDKSYEFSFEDKFLWEAITEGYNITKIPFERRGKQIIFGAVPKVVEHKFEYGFGNELLSVKHRNAKAKVINRITMLGSSENIPHYYPNETEYGHISIAAKDGNNVLNAGMFEIANMTQLLSRLNADDFAVLGKYDEVDVGESETEITSYYTSFSNDAYTKYNLGSKLRHDPVGTALNIPWHIRVYFNVVKEGVVECKNVIGHTWIQNNAPSDSGANILDAISLEKLTTPDGQDLSAQLDKQEGNVSLGWLDKGAYILQFAINIVNREGGRNAPVVSFCYLSSVEFGKAASQKQGYYWAVGNKKYDGVGSLGVKISEDITDDMIGDGFGWTASGRMPFQDHLIPPKYRETLGAERFYNAVNDTYIDPDTNNPYVFPNPFVEGAPSEYIHRNEEIKPTIEGIRNAVIDSQTGLGQLFGEIADIAYDANDNDVLKPDSEDSDKNNSLKYEHSFFYIKLNIFNGPYGFDLFTHATQTDAMTIQMRSGSCNGCKFKIQALEYEDETGLKSYKNPVQTRGANGNIVSGDYEDKVKEDWQEWQQNTQTYSIWICVQKDASTFGVLMPNQSNYFLPKIGDKFNITNIDMPLTYWYAAEKRLEEDGIRNMADNNEEKFTFDIQASRIFFAEHPEVLASLDEYSVIKVKYNGKTYEQYVNQLTIDCKDSEALPNISIDLTDTLAVGQSFIEQVAERASSLISNPYTMGGALGSGNGSGLTTRLADQRYLKKTEADRSKGKIASDIGFEVGEFVSGGSGGIFYQDPETGQTYIEVDKIKARMKAIYAELEVAKEKSIGGAFDITPGGSIDISFVEELTDSYRCYFKAKDEDKGADCRFVVGDQARCVESNISNGTAQDASNRYYWRLVTAVNNAESYIELSKTDCDKDSNDPIAGDTIVQLGNRDNSERQSAIVLSTVAAYAPSVTLYNSIDSYSLDGKSVVEYGVDKSQDPPEPFFNCYGRFFFGPKDGNSYLKFEPSIGKLVFSGELVNIGRLNGKDLDEYIKDVVPPITQEDIEGYVNAIVDPQIENIQNQIDGVIETWFYNGVPTLSNYPASEWDTENLKIQHLGDLYYDNDTGTAYRFSQDADGNYYWNTITDDAITKALAAAQKAQETADGKHRTFIAQPIPPYDEGDLWVNAIYPSNTTKDTRDPSNNKYYLDILRCSAPKAKGQSFDIADWGLASNYTDDTLAKKAIEDIKDYQYLKEALEGASRTEGGLFLTSYIKLGEWDKSDPDNPVMSQVWSGHNGLYHHPKTIASFWGGDMVDRFYDEDGKIRDIPLATGYAASLVRMDGSAYFAKGNIGFEADGSGWLGNYDNGIRFSTNGTMTFGSGIKVALNGTDEGLKETLESFLNISIALDNLLYPCDKDGERLSWKEATQSDGDGGIKAKSIRAVVGIWTDEFISIGKKNDSASGGSGSGASFGRLDSWGNYDASKGDALSAVLGYGLKTDVDWLLGRVASLEGGSALSVTTTGTGNAITSIAKSGTAIVATKGATFLTEHQSLENYVDRTSAQTIGGSKIFSNYASSGTTPVTTFASPTAEYPYITFRTKSNKEGNVGYIGSYVAIMTNKGRICVNDDGVPQYMTAHNENVQTLLHTGNYAASLDSRYALASALGNYLPLTGGTVSGANDSPLIIDSTHNIQNVIVIQHKGVAKGQVGYNTTQGTILYNYASQKYLGIKDDGTPHYQGNTLLHSGNISSYAITQHQSLANYVDKTSTQEISGGKRFYSYLTIVGSQTATSATRNSSGVLSFCEGGWNDNFAIWADFAGSGTTQNLYIGGGGTGIAINNLNTDSPALVPYLTINYSTGNLTVKGNIIKSGGTSSQFLKADGSVDGNSYATETYVTQNFVRALYGDDAIVNADMNEMLSNRSFIGSVMANSNTPNGTSWYNVIQLAHRNGVSDGSSYVGQIALGMTTNHEQMYFRTHRTRAWQRVLTNNNFSSILDNSYVKKLGDTMSGALTIKTDTQPCLKLDSNTANKEVYLYVYSGGTAKAAFGWSPTPTTGAYLYNSVCQKSIGVRDDGTPNFAGNTLWHSGNDGAGSGLDADLLDGLHETSFFRYRGDIPTAYVDITNYNPGANDYANYAPGTYTISRTGSSELLVNLALNAGSTSALQFRTSYSDSTSLMFRKTIDSNRVSGPWRTILTELNIGSYNAGSATKLHTARTIWGQSFDGTGNVSGSLSDVTDVRMAGLLCIKKTAHDTGFYLETTSAKNFQICEHSNYTWLRTALTITAGSNNFGFGTTAPAYKVDVNGNTRVGTDLIVGQSMSLGTTTVLPWHLLLGFHTVVSNNFFFAKNADGSGEGMYFTPEVTLDNKKYMGLFRHINRAWVSDAFRFYFDGTFHAMTGIYTDGFISCRQTNSDARLKNITGDLKLDIRDIANAPSVRFAWKDNGMADIGSIAQYFEAINPLFTPRNPNDYLTLQYGKTALLYLIPTAKMVLSHEDKIKLLESKVENLENENEELKNKISQLNIN